MGGSGWAELEKGSKAGGYSQGHAIGVVDGDTFQVLALAEAVYKALQALVRERTVKLRLDTFLQAFPKNFGSAGEIIAENAALGADLVGGEKKRNYNDTDNQRRNEVYACSHELFPFGQSEDFVFELQRPCESRRR